MPRLGRCGAVGGHGAGRRLRRRRPGHRARALHDRRRRGHRPRGLRRERHDDRRAHQDPVERLHHGVLHAGGGRLHRSLRDHHQRQLHGPHGAPPRAGQGRRDPSRGPGWRGRDAAARGGDRRGGVRRRRGGRPARRAAADAGRRLARRACCGRCRPTSCWGRSDAPRPRRAGCGDRFHCAARRRVSGGARRVAGPHGRRRGRSGAAGRSAARAGMRRDRRPRAADRARRAGAGAHRTALLPLRPGRRDAGGAGRRLADLGVGSEQLVGHGRAVHHPAGDGRTALAARPVRPAPHLGRRADDGRHRGEPGRAGLRPALVGTAPRRRRRRGRAHRPAARAGDRRRLRPPQRPQGARGARHRPGHDQDLRRRRRPDRPRPRGARAAGAGRRTGDPDRQRRRGERGRLRPDRAAGRPGRAVRLLAPRGRRVRAVRRRVASRPATWWPVSSVPTP